MNSNGIVQWAADGIAICTAPGQEDLAEITTDGAEGAIITWEDSRNSSSYDIYAQRVNANGVVQWATDGIPICRAENYQFRPQIVADSSRGAIIAWYDKRNSVDTDIYASRVDRNGNSPPTHAFEVSFANFLSQNVPNPFNLCTRVLYSIEQQSHVTLVIYDCSGKLVRTLIDRIEEAGQHEVTWDGKDDRHLPVASGIYFYRLTAGSHAETRKMVLLK